MEHYARSRGASVGVTLFLGVLTSSGQLSMVEAVMPTAGLRLSNGRATYAAPAWFGLQVPEEEDASYLPLRVPSGGADGCEDVRVDDAPEGGFVLLVERGNCYFDVKALAAQVAGAEGLVVMNSLEGIYQVCFRYGCKGLDPSCCCCAVNSMPQLFEAGLSPRYRTAVLPWTYCFYKR